jgi:drug/metabolite transporter (DMT)-like permease
LIQWLIAAIYLQHYKIPPLGPTEDPHIRYSFCCVVLSVVFIILILLLFFFFVFVFSLLSSKRKWLIIRGLCGGISLSFLYLGFAYLSLADATVLFFTNPIFTALLARFMLGPLLPLLPSSFFVVLCSCRLFSPLSLSLSLSLSLFLSLILSPLFLFCLHTGDRITWVIVVAAVFSISGVVLVSQPTFLFGPHGENNRALDPIGIFASILSAFLAGISYCSVKKVCIVPLFCPFALLSLSFVVFCSFFLLLFPPLQVGNGVNYVVLVNYFALGCLVVSVPILFIFQTPVAPSAAVTIPLFLALLSLSFISPSPSCSLLFTSGLVLLYRCGVLRLLGPSFHQPGTSV